jgi:hypothetical protein
MQNSQLNLTNILMHHRRQTRSLTFPTFIMETVPVIGVDCVLRETLFKQCGHTLSYMDHRTHVDRRIVTCPQGIANESNGQPIWSEQTALAQGLCVCEETVCCAKGGMLSLPHTKASSHFPNESLQSQQIRAFRPRRGFPRPSAHPSSF